MDKVKAPKNARILPFKTETLGSEDFEVSEVTRDIFSRVWNSYIDEPTMACVKLEAQFVDENAIETEEIVYAIAPHLALVD